MSDRAPSEQTPERPVTRLQRRMASRRDVLKLGAWAGVALPLVLTLAPSEARAQESGAGS